MQERDIQHALHDARRRWLAAAAVNTGGRWAVLPALAMALAAIVLSLALGLDWPWMLALTVTAVAGVAVALALTWRRHANPGRAGAPDYTLLLDRAMGLGDALPCYMEANGPFRAALAAQLHQSLRPQAVKAAAPRKHYGPLLVALLLALLPMALLLPDPTEAEPASPQAAGELTEPEGDASPDPGSGAGGGGPGDDAPGSSGGGKGSGEGEGNPDKGEAQQRPDSSPSEGTGEQPDAPPSPEAPQKRPDSGDSPDAPPPVEAPKDPPKIETDDHRIRPETGEGDTRTEDRKRWLYNPDGKQLDGSTPSPPPVENRPERALDRTKLTSRESRLLKGLFRRLYE